MMHTKRNVIGHWAPCLILNSYFTWLQQTFSEADKNGDGNLSLGEVLQLLHKLNVNLPRQKVREMFKVRSYSDVHKSGDEITKNILMYLYLNVSHYTLECNNK